MKLRLMMSFSSFVFFCALFVCNPLLEAADGKVPLEMVFDAISNPSYEVRNKLLGLAKGRLPGRDHYADLLAKSGWFVSIENLSRDLLAVETFQGQVQPEYLAELKVELGAFNLDTTHLVYEAVRANNVAALSALLQANEFLRFQSEIANSTAFRDFGLAQQEALVTDITELIITVPENNRISGRDHMPLKRILWEFFGVYGSPTKVAWLGEIGTQAKEEAVILDLIQAPELDGEEFKRLLNTRPIGTIWLNPSYFSLIAMELAKERKSELLQVYLDFLKEQRVRVALSRDELGRLISAARTTPVEDLVWIGGFRASLGRNYQIPSAGDDLSYAKELELLFDFPFAFEHADFDQLRLVLGTLYRASFRRGRLYETVPFVSRVFAPRADSNIDSRALMVTALVAAIFDVQEELGEFGGHFKNVQGQMREELTQTLDSLSLSDAEYTMDTILKNLKSNLGTEEGGSPLYIYIQGLERENEGKPGKEISWFSWLNEAHRVLYARRFLAENYKIDSAVLSEFLDLSANVLDVLKMFQESPDYNPDTFRAQAVTYLYYCLRNQSASPAKKYALSDEALSVISRGLFDFFNLLARKNELISKEDAVKKSRLLGELALRIFQNTNDFHAQDFTFRKAFKSGTSFAHCRDIFWERKLDRF